MEFVIPKQDYVLVTKAIMETIARYNIWFAQIIAQIMEFVIV
jgi:hypothetical protein